MTAKVSHHLNPRAEKIKHECPGHLSLLRVEDLVSFTVPFPSWFMTGTLYQTEAGSNRDISKQCSLDVTRHNIKTYESSFCGCLF